MNNTIRTLALLTFFIGLPFVSMSIQVRESKSVGGAIVEILPEKTPLGGGLEAAYVPTLTAPGTMVKKNIKAEIDYSNTKDGYVMVRYLQKTGKTLRAIIKAPRGESYTYALGSDGSYEAFPLSEGSGSYQVGVYEQLPGGKYSTVISATLQATLSDEFAPFLRPNQYVYYSSGSDTVKKAVELTKGKPGLIDKITVVYNYVTKNITYDKKLAETVKSGYLPDVDSVLKSGKGICFDYAAVMTAMLRSRQIPSKLIVGYAGNAYHAWINVYSEETGWIDGAIYFDGTSWQLMDPTFAANKALGGGSAPNYTSKYMY